MLRLLRSRTEFRRIFLAHSVSRAGDAFNTVALVVLAFQLTGSGPGVAATVAFEVAPVLLFGPVAGVVADRFARRRVMIAADVMRAALVSVLVVSHSTVATAFAVAFGLSAATLLFNPAAAASLVPEVVEDDELVAANSALWTTGWRRRSSSRRWRAPSSPRSGRRRIRGQRLVDAPEASCSEPFPPGRTFRSTSSDEQVGVEAEQDAEDDH